MPGPAATTRRGFSPAAFVALRSRNYRLYFAGQFISMCGTWLQGVAQGWLVWQLTKNPLAVGTVTFCGSTPMLLLSLAGGTLADRVDRRRLILVTQTLAGLLAASLGFVTHLPGLQVWHICAIAACLGVVNAFDVPTRQAFVVEMVDRSALMNAIALNSLLFNSARVLGPSMAGAMLAIPWIGVSGCFYLNAASYVAAIIAIYLIRTGVGPPTLTGEPPMAAAMAGVRYVFSTPVLRRLIALLAAVGIFGWSISVLLQAMADQVLHIGARGYGALTAAMGAGAVVAAFSLANLGDNRHARNLVYGGVALACVGLATFALSHWFPLSLVGIALAGMGMITFSSTCQTVVQSVVTDELRGRVMGVWQLVFAGSLPLGGLLEGYVARNWGAPRAILLGAAVMAVIGTVVFLTSQRARAAASRLQTAER